MGRRIADRKGAGSLAERRVTGKSDRMPEMDCQLGPCPDATLEFDLPIDLDLQATLRGSHHTLPSPAEKRTEAGLALSTHRWQAPHQLRLTLPPDPNRRTISASAWGPEADTLVACAPDLLGVGDDGAAGFRPVERPLADWHRHAPGLRLRKAVSLFETLVPIVLAQKILGKEAMAIHRRWFRRAGEQAPGPPGPPVPPSPAALRETGYEDWHRFGLERRRARTLHRIAERADELESWRDLDTETLYANLTSIPGIGPWSANRLLYALGHADAVWIGDYNLPPFVAWNLAGEPRADDGRMLDLLEPYRGHRARVLRLIELHGRTPPRRGPRLPFRSIQRH